MQANHLFFFSFLTRNSLSVPNKTIIVDNPGAKTRSPHVGAIVGGTIGGVAAILAVMGMVTSVKRRQGWRKSRPISILSSSSNSVDFVPRPLVTGNSEAEMVALQYLAPYSLPTVLPLPRPVAPVPVGLSDKEMARLRSEALSSPQPGPHLLRVSTSNGSQSSSSSSPNAVTESGEAVLPYGRLHLEVVSLRREVERLREEGLLNAAPPSYDTEGDR